MTDATPWNPPSATGLTMHCCYCDGVCYHTSGPFFCRVHSMTVTPMSDTPALRTGWQCPRCRVVNAPSVQRCDCKAGAGTEL